MSEQQSPKPRPNPIVSEPATPAACARDYQAGAADRHASEKRDAKARR
ncbi:hypothetical protein ABT127_29630 [Streptomyces sp. NPDC001904]